MNIFSESGRKVGFYKRKFKQDREILKYGTDRYEKEIICYYENGKLMKETSENSNLMSNSRNLIGGRSRSFLFRSIWNQELKSENSNLITMIQDV